MQVQTQIPKIQENKENRNRAEILQKALPIAQKVYQLVKWTLEQNGHYDPWRIRPRFFNEWLNAEIRRLWGIELNQEEASYLWQKVAIGF
ncbi:MAG: hypothetical protein C0177_02725 [Fervidicoccus fontis]|nr:MAG: hypothetical protein C0177_02725 [Fervidicoccus fontis]